MLIQGRGSISREAKWFETRTQYVLISGFLSDVGGRHCQVGSLAGAAHAREWRCTLLLVPCDAGTKHVPNAYFVPDPKKESEIGPQVSNPRSRPFPVQGSGPPLKLTKLLEGASGVPQKWKSRGHVTDLWVSIDLHLKNCKIQNYWY